MKKVTYDQYGSLDVLALTEVSVPTPDKKTLRVRVKAAAINPLDWKIWQGDMKIMTGFSFPKSVGIDFAGIVDEVGSEVQNFSKGDEVLGMADIFKGGALAEYVVVKEEAIAHKPATISFEQAAALPVVGSSAIQIFEKLAPLKAGMEVLINGATGGIGTVAIQLAKQQGAHVTAVVRTNGVDLAEKLGSDVVINHEQENVLEQEKQYDVILDFANKFPFDKAEKIMKPESVYVSTLPSPTALVSSFVHDLFSKKKREILNLSPSPAYLTQIADQAAKGLTVVVNATYPLDAFKQAYADAAKGGTLGKVVITV